MKIRLRDISFNYINMPHRTDRDEHIKIQLDKLNLKAKKFKALSGNENYLNIETPSASNVGNIGCILSHIKLLNEYKGKKILGVLEDDVEFCDDFIFRMKYIEDNFNYDWDIFFLSSFYHLNDDQNFKWKDVEFEFTGVKYIHRVYSSFTTHSYLVNPNSIQKILNLCYQEMHKCYAIDHLYILIQDKLNCFSFTPGMTMQYTNYSDLSGSVKSQEEFINKLGNHIYAKNLEDFDYDEYFNIKKLISKDIKKYYFFNENFKYSIFNFDYFTTEYKIPSEVNIKEIQEYTNILSIVNGISKDKHIIDIGGNCGLFCIPAALYGYKVYSFEPVKANINLIENGIKENNCNNLHLVKVALSDFDGMLDIYIPYCSDNSSFNKNVAISNMSNKTYIKENVKCATFDNWYSKNKNVNVGFIKIDVQGFEKNVLYGMSNFIKNNKDFLLFIEWDKNHTEECGNSLDQIYDFLITNGLEEIPFSGTNDKLFQKK